MDQWRREREEDIQHALRHPEQGIQLRRRHAVEFEGEGVLLVAKSTVQPNAMPQCLGLGDVGNVVQLVPCFYPWVPSNLLPRWETGAVITAEVRPHNKWEWSPCTSTHGRLERNPVTGGMTVHAAPNHHNNTTTTTTSRHGPLCMLKQVDGGMYHGLSLCRS